MLPWLSMHSIAFAEEGGNADGVTDATPSTESTTVQEQDQLDVLEARLLGELPSETMINAPYESNELNEIFWVLPLFVMMVALFVWSKIRTAAPINPGEIRVLSKTPLGKEGSLAVIVVGEEGGSEQKMLVGLSEQGAPRLLSVLDAKWRDASQGQSVNALADFDQFLSQVTPASSENTPAQSDQHLENRNDLVEELLTARGVKEYQRVSNNDASSISESAAVQPQAVTSFADANFGEEEESVVDDDPWVVNFRRKYQQS